MTSITTLVMQDERRGEPSRKQPIRLPIIAPKDDRSSSGSSSRSGRLGTIGPSVPPRARLPPRSRTGCWTCRTRKVKCDEGRPVCGQCARLGHNCDYQPRLAFKDDTPRVLERMHEVTVVTSSVWDANSPALTETSASSIVADDLPPFSTLTTDEERERKAERANPGTYNVVVNQDSFLHLPEYTDDPDVKRELLSPLRRGSIATSLASTSSAVEQSGDPNIVVLTRFEDVARRGTFGSSKDPRTPLSPTTKAQALIKGEDVEDAITMDDPTSMDGSTDSGQDPRYLRQFRQVVWRQLIPAEAGHRDGIAHSSVAILEAEAKQFPPLFHAMMAVSAQSLSVQGGKERLDALQHYQQSLPALQSILKSTDDMSSDGAFLTHFLLLVYDIAGAQTGHENLWYQHISTLLQIILLRHQLLGDERFPFVIWWICNIDLEALFSGAGRGEFISYMLTNDLVPRPSFHLYPLGHDGSSVVYGDERETLATALQLDYEVTMLAARLAILGWELRHDPNFDNTDAMEREQEVEIRQSRIYEVQEAMRRLWLAPNVQRNTQNVESWPTRPKQIYEHAASLYRACIIYSHTSMWPGQRLETLPDYDTEILVASSQILHMARKALDEGRTDSRYLCFPVFIAGFASTDGGDRMQALDIIRAMEKQSIGTNTTNTRKALGVVYEKQNERFMTTGQSLDVDWKQVMLEANLTVANFGF